MISSISRGSIASGFKKYRSARAGEPSSANLLVHYKGGVSGGNPIAATGSSGTGSSLTEVTDGFSKCISFDGITNYSYIDTGFGANTAYSSLTTSAWINPSSTNPTSGAGFVVNNISYFATGFDDFPFNVKYDYLNQRVVLMLSYGGDFTTDLVLTASTLKNTWTHVAASYTAGGTAKLYVNGVLEASISCGTPSTSTRNFFWGRAALPNGGGVPGDPFNGRMDEMRIYNRQLSDAEVARLYDLGRG